jgi:hypothetical protein
MHKNENGNVVLWVLLGILGLILFIALMFGGRELGWWLAEDNVKRQTKILDESVGRQDALRSKMLRDIEAVRELDTYEQTPAITAQREALVDGVCFNAQKLNEDTINVSDSVSEFISTECNL